VKKLFYGIADSEEPEIQTNANIGIETKAVTPVEKVTEPVTEPVTKVVTESTTKLPTKLTTELPKVAEVKLCKHGYRIGLDFETKAECSDCLDENTKEYSECRKVRRTIQSL
jgi:hypothetical protein